MKDKIVPYLCDEQAETAEVLGTPEPERLPCPYCPDKESLDRESLDWHINTFHDDPARLP